MFAQKAHPIWFSQSRFDLFEFGFLTFSRNSRHPTSITCREWLFVSNPDWSQFWPDAILEHNLKSNLNRNFFCIFLWFLKILVKFYHDNDLNKNEFYSTDAQLDKNACDVNLIFMQNIRCTRFNINVFLAVQYDILLFNSSVIELGIPYPIFSHFHSLTTKMHFWVRVQ